MRRFAALVLLVACAHPGRSKDARGWLELQSEHFLLRTRLPEERARENLIDMEQVRTALLGAGWHGNREEKGRTIVVQLADRGEMEEFALKGWEGFSTRNAFGERLLVIHAGEDVFEQGLFKHELTHIISDGYLVSNPRWVAEGIACYLETLDIKRGKNEAVVGKPDSDRLVYLRDNRVQTWFGYIQTGREALNDAEYGYAFETRAWALVHYFVDNKPEAFQKYLTQLARGADAWRAFSEAFPGLREQELAAAMAAYLSSGKLGRETVPIQSWNGTVTARPLPAAEAHALRADLFRLSPGQNPRPDLADAEARQALQLDPGNPYALMLARDADPSPAIKAHPDDWRAWMLSFDRDGEKRADIERAAKLAPEEPDVLERLAVAELRANELKPALEHAARAEAGAPGRSDVLEVLAQTYAANGRCDEAIVTEQRSIDARPDAAVTPAPREMLERMRHLREYCDQPRGMPAIATNQLREVKVTSCKTAPPRLTTELEMRVEFTLGEDGTPRDVKVDGAAPGAQRTAVRKYVEGCRYEPFVVDGKPQAVPTTMIVSPPSHK